MTHRIRGVRDVAGSTRKLHDLMVITAHEMGLPLDACPEERTMKRWFSGETAPRSDDLMLVCIATRVSADWILGLTDDPSIKGSPTSPEMRAWAAKHVKPPRTLRTTSR